MKKTVPDAETVCGHWGAYRDGVTQKTYCSDCGAEIGTDWDEFIRKWWASPQPLVTEADVKAARPPWWQEQILKAMGVEIVMQRPRRSRLTRGISVLISRALSPFKGKDSGA